MKFSDYFTFSHSDPNCVEHINPNELYTDQSKTTNILNNCIKKEGHYFEDDFKEAVVEIKEDCTTELFYIEFTNYVMDWLYEIPVQV